MIGPYGLKCPPRQRHNELVRLTEFWLRMEHHLGDSYARTWARDQVLPELGERTVCQALEDGWPAKEVWRAVWRSLKLPASER